MFSLNFGKLIYPIPIAIGTKGSPIFLNFSLKGGVKIEENSHQFDCPKTADES